MCCSEMEHQVAVLLWGWPPQDAYTGSAGAGCSRGGQAGWSWLIPHLSPKGERASTLPLPSCANVAGQLFQYQEPVPTMNPANAGDGWES